MSTCFWTEGDKQKICLHLNAVFVSLYLKLAFSPMRRSSKFSLHVTLRNESWIFARHSPPKPRSEIDKHCVGEGNWEMSMFMPSHFSQVYKKKKVLLEGSLFFNTKNAVQFVQLQT